MRRALALVALAGLPASALAGTHRTTVGVGLREYRLSLYRDHVRPGIVKLNLTNFGEDPHDVAVRARSGRIVAHSAEVASGDRATLTVRLPHAGRFVVFCTLADHERLGMRARLTVTNRTNVAH
jgi:plastocyanin